MPRKDWLDRAAATVHPAEWREPGDLIHVRMSPARAGAETLQTGMGFRARAARRPAGTLCALDRRAFRCANPVDSSGRLRVRPDLAAALRRRVPVSSASKLWP